MAYTTYGSGGTEDPKRRVIEEAFRVARRVRRHVPAAPHAAADSFDKTAASHERTAKSFERLADLSEHQDQYIKHAGRHRHFARESRLWAEQLRRWADNASKCRLPNALAYA